MAIKFQKNDSQYNLSEMEEESNDLEIDEDNNSKNDKSITENIINILYFTIIGIIIALCLINSNSHNSTNKEPKIVPLTKLVINQKSHEDIKPLTENVQRRTTYCYFYITTENETNEVNGENTIRIIENGANSTRNNDCASCLN